MTYSTASCGRSSTLNCRAGKGTSLIDDVRTASLEEEWHVWDAENRLVEIATKLSLGANTMGYDEGDQRLRFVYDHMGRRSEKTHEAHTSGNWVMQSGYPKWFIYDGWNVQLVLRPGSTYDPVTNPTDFVTERKYTWGLDLSGSFHGAGGIGGLLAAVETQGTSQTADDVSYWYFYDANGNVGQLIDGTTPSTPVLAAHYEYDPYGHVINDLSSYTYAEDNPFRFSTKWLDTELAAGGQTGAVSEEGLYYYGYRYYSPPLGRWIKRDPIGEAGGLNLYVVAHNNTISGQDCLGLRDWLDDLSEFVAGVGDSLSFGLTQQVRKGINWLNNDGYQDSWVRKDSAYYIAGEVTETVVEIGVTFGGASLRHIAARTSREAIEGGARASFRRRHQLSGGFVHHINPIKGHPGGRMARYPLPFEWAARGEWNMKWVPTRAAHLAEHKRMIALEALDRVRESTMLVRQAGNAVFVHAVDSGCDDVSVSVYAGVYGEVTYGDAWLPPYGGEGLFDPPTSVEAYAQWIEAGNMYIVP